MKRGLLITLGAIITLVLLYGSLVTQSCSSQEVVSTTSTTIATEATIKTPTTTISTEETKQESTTETPSSTTEQTTTTQSTTTTTKQTTTTQAPTTTTTTIQTTTTQPEQQPSGQYVGSINSDVFHYPNCRYVKQIHAENVIWFSSREDAISKGYRPCKVCKP